jgi:hypothetical protein
VVNTTRCANTLVKKKYYEYRSFKSLMVNEISAPPYNKGREEGEEPGKGERR